MTGGELEPGGPRGRVSIDRPAAREPGNHGVSASMRSLGHIRAHADGQRSQNASVLAAKLLPGSTGRLPHR